MRTKSSTGRQTLSAEVVAEFLHDTPSFFRDYPEILRGLSVPHETGGALSLIERQVEALRKENKFLQEKLSTFVETANGNQIILGRLNELIVALIECQSMKGLLDCLYRSAREDFDVHATAIRLTGERVARYVRAGKEYVAEDDVLPNLFAEVLDKGEAYAGELSREQQTYLFGKQRKLHSFALLPLSGNRWQGICCLASKDPARFPADSGTELFGQVGRILSTLINRQLR